MRSIRHPLLLAALLSACGYPGDPGSPGRSGVESTKPIGATNAAEREQLCDFFDSLYMGETLTASCGPAISAQTGGPRTVCESIVAGFCGATVEELETCFLHGARDPCSLHDPRLCSTELFGCIDPP